MVQLFGKMTSSVQSLRQAIFNGKTFPKGTANAHKMQALQKQEVIQDFMLIQPLHKQVDPSESEKIKTSYKELINQLKLKREHLKNRINLQSNSAIPHDLQKQLQEDVHNASIQGLAPTDDIREILALNYHLDHLENHEVIRISEHENNSFALSLMFGTLISANVAIKSGDTERIRRMKETLQIIKQDMAQLMGRYTDNLTGDSGKLEVFASQFRTLATLLTRIEEGEVYTTELVYQANIDVETEANELNLALVVLSGYMLSEEVQKLGFPEQEKIINNFDSKNLEDKDFASYRSLICEHLKIGSQTILVDELENSIQFVNESKFNRNNNVNEILPEISFTTVTDNHHTNLLLDAEVLEQIEEERKHRQYFQDLQKKCASQELLDSNKLLNRKKLSIEAKNFKIDPNDLKNRDSALKILQSFKALRENYWNEFKVDLLPKFEQSYHKAYLKLKKDDPENERLRVIKNYLLNRCHQGELPRLDKRMPKCTFNLKSKLSNTCIKVPVTDPIKDSDQQALLVILSGINSLTLNSNWDESYEQLSLYLKSLFTLSCIASNDKDYILDKLNQHAKKELEQWPRPETKNQNQFGYKTYLKEQEKDDSIFKKLFQEINYPEEYSIKLTDLPILDISQEKVEFSNSFDDFLKKIQPKRSNASYWIDRLNTDRTKNKENTRIILEYFEKITEDFSKLGPEYDRNQIISDFNKIYRAIAKKCPAETPYGISIMGEALEKMQNEQNPQNFKVAEEHATRPEIDERPPYSWTFIFPGWDKISSSSLIQMLTNKDFIYYSLIVGGTILLVGGIIALCLLSFGFPIALSASIALSYVLYSVATGCGLGLIAAANTTPDPNKHIPPNNEADGNLQSDQQSSPVVGNDPSNNNLIPDDPGGGTPVNPPPS